MHNDICSKFQWPLWMERGNVYTLYTVHVERYNSRCDTWKYGDRNVLSTANRMLFLLRAIPATFSISIIFIVGLDGVSIHINYIQRQRKANRNRLLVDIISSVFTNSGVVSNSFFDISRVSDVREKSCFDIETISDLFQVYASSSVEI